MQGERRVVTVLFCDVKGSTAMAERLDPEEWAEIMNSAFERLIKPVYRYEGTVARLMGDAILAFFGAPIAHEDDPQRAVLAGLGIVEGIQDFREQMKRERGLDFNVRVGINTGLVVVGEIGSDLRVEYTAMGDAVNVAARMEQTAQPGTVQIAENTHRLIAPLFEFEPLGGIEVKGKSEPVMAYRVLRPKAQPGRLRGIEGLDSPLVGRSAELGTLRRVVADLRAGRGHIVCVMGEAGLGKSRLMAELLKQTEDGGRQTEAASVSHPPSSVQWYEGRSLSYETTTPYAPFANLFTRLFDLRAEESDEQKYAKLKSFIADVDPDGVLETAPFIATLLGIKFGGADAERVRYLEPPNLRGRTFAAVLRFFEQLAMARPLVLVFEDLHWADPTSLDLLEQLAPLTERARLMIVAVFRPQRQEPSWRFHEMAARDYAQAYTAITLEPLDEAHSRELVANLLHIEDLPEKVRALILKKAEGNPFFVEEVIRSLLDAKLVVRTNGHWRATREIENIAVPDTLAGVITARLDRLDEESKRTAQTAAVIGREFPFNTLAAIADARPMLDSALNELQKRELIREKSRLPQRLFLFKHALTQETAYASMLLRQRRELHRRIAETLARSEPERVNDIARHFLEAQENARALPYLVEAGDRAAHAYSTPEAIGYYTKALAILKTVDDLPLARRAYEGLGGALSLTNDVQRAVQIYDEMYQLARQRGDVPMQVSALNKLSFVSATRLGDFPRALQLLDDSERLARAHDDKMGISELSTIRCMMCTATADFSGVVKHMGEAMEIGRELGLKDQMAMALDHVASTQTFMTEFEQAWQNAQDGLRISREAGNRLHEATLLGETSAFYHLRNGDLAAARQAATEGLNIAQQIGAAMPQTVAAFSLALIARASGEYESAIEYYQRMIQAGNAGGYIWYAAMALGALGVIYLEISPALRDQALAYRAQALHLMENPMSIFGGATIWTELGYSALATDELDVARANFAKTASIPTTPMHIERPRVLVGEAMIALRQNDLDAAARYISEARVYTEERAMKNFYPLLAMADAWLNLARGEREQALADFTRAEELATPMNMRPLLWQARAGAAQVLAALGRHDEAEAKRREARAMVEEIANLFSDETLRAQFVENTQKGIDGGQA